MNTQKRLFIDMDGTLAEYRTFEAMEQYYQKGYFESLKPLQNVIDAIKIIINKYPEIQVYTLSACPVSSSAPEEKNIWLDRHLPEIQISNRIYSIIGESKKDCIPNGINKNDYLLDDYPHNLHDWAQEGCGIKLFNGLNANLEKWSGSSISYKNSPEHIAQALVDVIIKGKIIVDEMDEIQIKNEEKGKSLFIDRNELIEIINKYFLHDFTDIDDFRRNYTVSDWDFVSRISSTARIEIHTTAKQYKFEYETIKKKIDNTLSIVVESLSNQRKDLVEKELYFALREYNGQDFLQNIIQLEDSYNIWHDYFTKTITDLNKMTENFFSRYEAASKGNDFANISLHTDANVLFKKIEKIKNICKNIYNQDKSHFETWRKKCNIKKREFNNAPKMTMGDAIFNDNTVISVPQNNGTNDVLDINY
jgi:hypothetical protein